MGTDQIMYCIVALILGMLLANMLESVCGCKVVEGHKGPAGEMMGLMADHVTAAADEVEAAAGDWKKDAVWDPVQKEYVAKPDPVDCVEEIKSASTCTDIGQELWHIITEPSPDGVQCVGRSTLCQCAVQGHGARRLCAVYGVPGMGVKRRWWMKVGDQAPSRSARLHNGKNWSVACLYLEGFNGISVDYCNESSYDPGLDCMTVAGVR